MIPRINIYTSLEFKNEEIFLESISGVEEESVPYEVKRNEQTDDAASLSFKAACESTLEVGIGIDSNGSLAVHYKKLPPEKPLFIINYKKNPEAIRSICSNAARLVKGTPFILGSW